MLLVRSNAIKGVNVQLFLQPVCIDSPLETANICCFTFTMLLVHCKRYKNQLRLQCVSHGADKRVSGVATVGWSEVQQ